MNPVSVKWSGLTAAGSLAANHATSGRSTGMTHDVFSRDSMVFLVFRRIQMVRPGALPRNTPLPVSQAFGSGLKCASDVKLADLASCGCPIVTARCSCSGSAAGARLLVEWCECGQTASSETAGRAPPRRFHPPHINHMRSLELATPPPGAAISLDVLYQSGNFMDAQFAIRPRLSWPNSTASLYHLLEPVNQMEGRKGLIISVDALDHNGSGDWRHACCEATE
jgi:hypothetical protein